MFLFNDALNTVYLRLYGVRHMEKDNSYSEREKEREREREQEREREREKCFI